MIPVLETARLRLRPHSVEDFEALATIWADPEVTRHIGGRPFTREESWARMLRYAGLWRLLGFGYWAVEDRATGRFLGDVGFADFQRAMDPPAPHLPEIGWVLAPEAHGRGLATEAAAAALEWLGRDCFCIIAPEHAASLRVAAKLGFGETGLADYRDSQVKVLVRAA
ncbi:MULTISPECIES: GNAT family N-acetyltransferase [Roseomonadaceae]|uniref:GNAT family N-acetyltransferase n=1 Tax=Falsiroseomonas oleicola TaxID=2801474 RepID=A0ABS6H2S8_9PROT|nr:GNAT family N-acetyltransferase [Roseomonas oleicola]MBU8542338.1 GNAT family N-acetyltransferase [Roseomonas oleicola]